MIRSLLRLGADVVELVAQHYAPVANPCVARPVDEEIACPGTDDRPLSAVLSDAADDIAWLHSLLHPPSTHCECRTHRVAELRDRAEFMRRIEQGEAL